MCNFNKVGLYICPICHIGVPSGQSCPNIQKHIEHNIKHLNKFIKTTEKAHKKASKSKLHFG